jgi:hypothetical protein
VGADASEGVALQDDGHSVDEVLSLASSGTSYHQIGNRGRLSRSSTIEQQGRELSMVKYALLKGASGRAGEEGHAARASVSRVSSDDFGGTSGKAFGLQGMIQACVTG